MGSSRLIRLVLETRRECEYMYLKATQEKMYQDRISFCSFLVKKNLLYLIWLTAGMKWRGWILALGFITTLVPFRISLLLSICVSLLHLMGRRPKLLDAALARCARGA